MLLNDHVDWNKYKGLLIPILSMTLFRLSSLWDHVNDVSSVSCSYKISKSLFILGTVWYSDRSLSLTVLLRISEKKIFRNKNLSEQWPSAEYPHCALYFLQWMKLHVLLYTVPANSHFPKESTFLKFDLVHPLKGCATFVKSTASSIQVPVQAWLFHSAFGQKFNVIEFEKKIFCFKMAAKKRLWYCAIMPIYAIISEKMARPISFFFHQKMRNR